MDVPLILFTDEGCEQACIEELRAYTSNNAEKALCVVRVSVPLLVACKIAYGATTIRRAIIALTDATRDIEQTTPATSLIDALIESDATFKVAGETIGTDEHPQELIERIAAWIFPHLKRKVDLKHPDATIYASAIGDRVYVGYDLWGDSLSQREWRVMLSRRSLKATIAASAAIYAGITTKDRVLDPIADDGTLAIETALLLTKTSPRKFTRILPFERIPTLAGERWAAWRAQESVPCEKILAYTQTLREMNAIRTNSKLAGIASKVHATRISVDWLDLKVEKGSIDKILTHPPESGKVLSVENAQRAHAQLFERAQHTLTPKGTITCVCSKPDELIPIAQEKGFNPLANIRVRMGKLPMAIVTFGR